MTDHGLPPCCEPLAIRGWSRTYVEGMDRLFGEWNWFQSRASAKSRRRCFKSSKSFWLIYCFHVCFRI